MPASSCTKVAARWATVAAAGVLLGGCAAGGAPPEQMSTERTPTESSTTDPAGQTKSASEAARTREDYLAGYAEAFRQTDPPEVPVVREVAPEEQPELIDACVAEQGFVPFAPGSWEFPEDQQEAFNLARYVCYAQYPIKVEYDQPLTDAQWLFVRQYWIDTMIPCLADLGYDIAPPPTESTFLANINSAEGYWPSGELMNFGLDPGRSNEVNRACPEMPPSAELFQH